MNKHQDNLHGRILWQSRRGMLELDLLLMPFCQEQYLHLSEDKQASYRELITHEDNQLYSWLMGFVVPEQPSLLAMVEDIRNYAQRSAAQN